MEKSPEAGPAEEVAEWFGSLVDAGDVASISHTQHLMSVLTPLFFFLGIPSSPPALISVCSR
jgi:hypothetical protein